MMYFLPLLALAAWFSIVSAVDFIAPHAQAVLDVTSSIDIEWSFPENATSYLLGTDYSIWLCAGGNEEKTHERVAHLFKGTIFSNPVQTSVEVDPTVGGEYPNGYFLEAVLTGMQGYSYRFTLTGMTGSFSPIVEKGLQLLPKPDGSETLRIQERQVPAPGAAVPPAPGAADPPVPGAADPPAPGAPVPPVPGAGNPPVPPGGKPPAGAPPAGAPPAGVPPPAAAPPPAVPPPAVPPPAAEPTVIQSVPYSEQTGTMRFAPMPMHPPKKISLKSPKPQFPTSPYKIATTFLPPPTVRTTISASVVQTAEAHENTHAPADMDEDMARFLKRWQD
ncbi:hypothetical protein MGYG_00833 [Nannizzia gypsea CBS 118893]|uniref:Uncharacterized protein n=1 Tax=Arthroderma gypseum (strain ATCC MYA-4604 / CBS 118893) TaxID=535722 RepID=E5R214_ARTGP|nr:hypothetical protein MGYG_00833 [Nannizzia gypsea CBS 118893]EFQ97793.1 hypothetical protein MGYG_00833 [Nannizzia gypsea CBS 118893]